MKVILREDVHNLGSLGDEVNVKPGYARNFLLPQNKAFAITTENYKIIQNQRKKLEELRLASIEKAKALAAKIEEIELSFSMKASEEGTLFGSVNSKQILDMLNEKGIHLDQKNAIPSEHIKKVGSYDIPVKLHSAVKVNLKINVIDSDKEAAELQAKLEKAAAESEKAADPEALSDEQQNSDKKD